MQHIMHLARHLALCTLIGWLAMPISRLLAQQEAGLINANYDVRFTRVGLHNGNRVKTAFANTGFIGQPAGFTQLPRGSWPVEENTYLPDINIIIGIQGVRDTLINFTVGADSVRGFRLRDRRNVSVALRDTVGRFFKGDTLAMALRYQEWYVTSHPSVRFGEAPGGKSGTGEFWGITPYEGFWNPLQNSVAMSHIPNSWPSSWPGNENFPTDPATGRAVWNGYFGPGITNADQESYFAATDGKDKQYFSRYNFQPLPSQPNRYGLGLDLRMRGLQFSNFLAQDVIFWLYEIKNISIYDYDKVFFGSVVGTDIGGGGTGGIDGVSAFDQANSITYSFKSTLNNPPVYGAWNRNFYPPGYAGAAFLESPGNPFDGIDNDGDWQQTTLATETPSIFNKQLGAGDYDFSVVGNDTVCRRVIVPGSWLILIEKRDTLVNNRRLVKYIRRAVRMPNTDTTVVSLGNRYALRAAGTVLTEISNNLLDDNLNGVIDENYKQHVGRRRIEYDLVQRIVIPREQPALAFVNYIALAQRFPTGIPAGSGIYDPLEINRTLYPMIDERRDEGLDNNGDGFTDAVDVKESDQIGLTGFAIRPNEGLPIASPQTIDLIPQLATPGTYDIIADLNQTIDQDYLYSTGYFPLPAGQTERFSIALLFGTDAQSIVETKNIVQAIYDANYNFARPPTPPTLRAYTDDKRVTLYWDAVAEDYRDEFIRRRLNLPPGTNDPRVKNFEGYKIIKATDPNFADALVITGSRGEEAQQFKAIAQFDLDNDVFGNFPLTTRELLQQSRGIAYYLGNNSGLQRTFTDSNVVNGRLYFYAVLAYTRGDTALSLYPAENTPSARPDGQGNFILGTNVVAVTPQPKVGGFTIPKQGDTLQPLGRVAGTGSVRYTIVDPLAVKNKTYKVQFFDTATDTIDNNDNGLIDDNDLEELLSATSFFSVIDITNPNAPDTIIKRSRRPLNKRSSYNTRDPELYVGDDNIFNGTYLTIRNITRGELNQSETKWARPEINGYDAFVLATDTAGRNYFTNPLGVFATVLRPDDYEIEIVPFGAWRSDTVRYIRTSGLPTTISQSFIGRPTNFIIRNAVTRDTVRFFLTKRSTNRFDTVATQNSGTIEIGLPFYQTPRRYGPNQDLADSVFSWTFAFTPRLGPNRVVPQVGDKFIVRFNKPFRRGDEFTFQTREPFIDNDRARSALDKVKVVPNPYIARSQYEQPLPLGVTRGRGERVIRFTHVPKGATIRIYTIRGDLVQTLKQDGSIEGDVTWDLRSRERLDVAYGLYLYHLDAPGIGTKTGKFVLIK
jgi:hypothetical protein